mmetsp:Transcript_15238/g.29738  ORF Transcript_15238/g.29738 Transcript_15238/m.29738 type:complete len:849 (+) Transcript_15238:205-2751(+)
MSSYNLPAMSTLPALNSESQMRINALSSALQTMNATTLSACRNCDTLSRRSRHLDSLTSPASEASALLAQTSSNLTATSNVLKDAREKFDTVADCEPAVERLYWGAHELCKEVARHAERQGRGAVLPITMKGLIDGSDRARNNNEMLKAPLSEQDLYAGADAMEIVRDAHAYFSKRMDWKSTKDTLSDLERVHHLGVDAMGLLVIGHLTGAGAAVRRKVEGAPLVEDKDGKKKPAMRAANRAEEAAAQTRDRLQEALQNRDLMKTIGEYEEYLPLSTRVVRELRAIFECLGAMSTNGSGLVLSPLNKSFTIPPPEPILPPGGKIMRTEKVGSGHYTNLTMKPLKTGYPQLDSYGEARKSVAYASVDGYCRQLRNIRKKTMGSNPGNSSIVHHANVDSAARDAVRCIEHAMVVVSGEKSVYRCVVAPASSNTQDESKVVAPHYQRALGTSYSYVAASAVDRLLDLIEYTFLREAGCAGNLGSVTEASNNPGAAQSGPTGTGEIDMDIRAAASAAAAGLRIVDGVRMLGPSLSKLCELTNPCGIASATEANKGPPESTIASALCISLHRSTVKNCSKTLENLARSIQLDPLDGRKHRPADARVATVSSDVVHAIRLITPFTSAYKSVSKRRALPWDPNVGENSGEMDTFIRFLVKQLIISLQGKAQNYKNDGGVDAQAKSNVFMMNNTFYLLELLGPVEGVEEQPADDCRIQAPWFTTKISKIFDSEKAKYLTHWESLNKHLTAVDDKELNYQTNKDVLSLESGRLLKSRFSGFIEDFERVYVVHRDFTVIDLKLRDMLQRDIRRVFLARYKAFFDKYSRIQFSKKNMENYLKYPPQKVDSLIGQLFAMQ